MLLPSSILWNFIIFFIFKVKFAESVTSEVSGISKLVNSIERMEDKRLERLISRYNCEHFYVDMGTNIGVQIRKVYQAEKYPGALALPVFDQYFGPGRRCNVCSIGFEPNPSHRAHLYALQERFNNAGIGVLIFFGAANTHTGVLKYGTKSKKVDKKQDWGGSVVRASNSKLGQSYFRSVRSIDVARIIRTLDSHLRNQRRGSRVSSKIVMKSDIEGSEFTVFPHLLFTNTICSIDFLFAEWHERSFRPRESTKVRNLDHTGDWEIFNYTVDIKTFFNSQFSQHFSKSCPTVFSDIDDETYRDDKTEFTPEILCRARKY